MRICTIQDKHYMLSQPNIQILYSTYVQIWVGYRGGSPFMPTSPTPFVFGINALLWILKSLIPISYFPFHICGCHHPAPPFIHKASPLASLLYLPPFLHPLPLPPSSYYLRHPLALFFCLIIIISIIKIYLIQKGKISLLSKSFPTY